jgi:hypothetical protein
MSTLSAALSRSRLRPSGVLLVVLSLVGALATVSARPARAAQPKSITVPLTATADS